MSADLLRTTWATATAGDRGHALAVGFYSRLFVKHPELRSMFAGDMADQRKKLVATVSLVVRSVDNLDAVVPILQRLGRDHVRFGVVAADYDHVGEALVAALEVHAADVWTEQAAQAWGDAYRIVADVMVSAAEAAEQAEAVVWHAEVVGVSRSGRLANLKLKAPVQEFAGIVVAPVAIDGRPGEWRHVLVARADPAGTHWIATVTVDPHDPPTLALAQAEPGAVLHIGEPTEQEAPHGP